MMKTEFDKAKAELQMAKKLGNEENKEQLYHTIYHYYILNNKKDSKWNKNK